MKVFCLYILSLVGLFLVSCDDESQMPGETGQLIIEFDNRAGDENLELNKNYSNSSNETFSISKLNYYISNIKLKTNDGKEFVVPQDSSYFLVREEDEESLEVILRNITAGDYNQITFTIGVDSLRSIMDISKRPGVLDPGSDIDDMYWTLESGYIFFRMEGISPAAPAEQDNKFYYNIGGFGGYNTPGLNNIRERTIDMGNAIALVRPNKSPEVHFHADVLEFFKNPTMISIAEHSSVILSDYSKTVSINYVNMFTYDHVHN
jgi:hypothetical protein